MTVYLSEHICDSARKKLEAAATIVDNFDHPEEIDAIIVRTAPVTAELLEKATKLKVIGKHGVGYNNVDVAAVKAKGIPMVYTPLANADSVAEMVVGLFLLLERGLYAANQKCRRGEFQKIAPADFLGTQLRGKTLGQIGMGNIAQRIAKILCDGFGVKILGYDPFISTDEAVKRGFEKVDTVAELLERADMVNINVPLIDSTRNLIAGEMFNHFKPSAVLVNAARGGIVNEEDLYDALVSGKLKAAACDTFVVEPPKPGRYKDLFSLENFSATPHLGGNTDDALENAGNQVVDDILTVLAGGKPSCLIPELR